MSELIRSIVDDMLAAALRAKGIDMGDEADGPVVMHQHGWTRVRRVHHWRGRKYVTGRWRATLRAIRWAKAYQPTEATADRRTGEGRDG